MQTISRRTWEKRVQLGLNFISLYLFTHLKLLNILQKTIVDGLVDLRTLQLLVFKNNGPGIRVSGTSSCSIFMKTDVSRSKYSS